MRDIETMKPHMDASNAMISQSNYIFRIHALRACSPSSMITLLPPWADVGHASPDALTEIYSSSQYAHVIS